MFYLVKGEEKYLCFKIMILIKTNIFQVYYIYILYIHTQIKPQPTKISKFSKYLKRKSAEILTIFVSEMELHFSLISALYFLVFHN